MLFYMCVGFMVSAVLHQAVAKDILDKCTVSPPNRPDPGDIQYSVLFNYEFVEDFQDENHDR